MGQHAAGGRPPDALAAVELAPEHAARLSAEDRRIVRICLSVLAVLGTGSLIGVAFSLYLIEEAPLLLIGLSPLGRHFVLAAPTVDPVAFVAVGTARRLAFYVACFYLGRALGPVGLVWIEARARRFARWVRWLERLFQRAGHVVVLVGVGPTVSTLAGISGMRLLPFAGLATISLFFRLVVLYAFAEAFSGPIERVLDWIAEYRLPGTIVIIAGIAIWQYTRRRRAGV